MAVRYTLLVAAMASGATVLLGMALASGDSYEGRFITYHMWAGVLTAATAIGALLMYELGLATGDRRAHRAYAALLFVSIVAVSIGGHLGGTLVQGDGYLTERAPTFIKTLLGVEEDIPPAVAFDTPVYASIIRPMMRDHCFECHNFDKYKGKLRLDTYESLLKASDSGKPAVSPGNPDDSEIVRRINFPRTSKSAMPPDGHAPLSASDITLLTWWIDIGAPQHSSVSELRAEDYPGDISAIFIERMAAEPVSAKVDAIPESEFQSLSSDLRNAYGIDVFPVSQDPHDGLWISARNMFGQFDQESINALLKLAPYVVEIDFSGRSLNSSGLEFLREFRSLQTISFARTPIGDAEVAHLVELPALRSLNLFGTEVTDAAAETLAKIKSLRRLNLYQTAVTDKAGQQIRHELPHCAVTTGLRHQAG